LLQKEIEDENRAAAIELTLRWSAMIKEPYAHEALQTVQVQVAGGE
jgi:hypothetical protein